MEAAPESSLEAIEKLKRLLGEFFQLESQIKCRIRNKSLISWLRKEFIRFFKPRKSKVTKFQPTPKISSEIHEPCDSISKAQKKTLSPIYTGQINYYTTSLYDLQTRLENKSFIGKLKRFFRTTDNTAEWPCRESKEVKIEKTKLADENKKSISQFSDFTPNDLSPNEMRLDKETLFKGMHKKMGKQYSARKTYLPLTQTSKTTH